jgi:hypothetical protein
MSDEKDLMNWICILLFVIGLFFFYLGVRDWLHKRRFPTRLVPEHPIGKEKNHDIIQE